MKCTCGSGLNRRTTPQGEHWCAMCVLPRRAQGRMFRNTRDIDMDRQAITRNMLARREIEARRDLEPIDAYE
jgi:hypothetical protein